MHDYLKEYIRTIPDFPKPGIRFLDLTTLMKNGKIFGDVVEILTEHYLTVKCDLVAGIESRGFIFGAALAANLGKGFIPVRKRGKLPAESVSQAYTLEYGENVIEMHKDAVQYGQKVVMIDDLLATGGTMLAACKLVEMLGGTVEECGVVVNLSALKGRDRIKDYKFYGMLEY